MKVVITNHAAERLHERAPEIPFSLYEKVAMLAYKRYGKDDNAAILEQYAKRQENKSATRVREGEIAKASLFGEYVYIFYERGEEVILATVFRFETVFKCNNFRYIHRRG